MGRKLITALRESQGWSRAELGRRSRVHPKDIGQLELGRLIPCPGSAMLARIARVLGVPKAEAHTLLDEAPSDAGQS